jgi:hypothetical protein
LASRRFTLPGPTTMDHMGEVKMADESHWNGIEETIEDPEEVRVIFCALDSYLSVPTRWQS